MQDFITHHATVYALLGYGAFVTAVCVGLAYLWQLEKDEAEKAEGAARFFEDKSAELIKIGEHGVWVYSYPVAPFVTDRDGHREELKHAADLIIKLDSQLEESRKTNKALTDTNAHLSDILSCAYIRNAYGQLQRYDDWAINGDKKPKPRKPTDPKKKKRKKGKVNKGARTVAKPMTRAEYVRALLKEAAESEQFKNEVWPKSALEQICDRGIPNSESVFGDPPLVDPPLVMAIFSFNVWDKSKEGIDYWDRIAHSEAVRNFKPKTKWVK